MELLIGCGSRREKLIGAQNNKEWTELVTLDINADHKPDVVWDLNIRPLPFADETFSEIHAYEVLEHLGRQGDYLGWFDEWSEWYRLLKPDGLFYGTSPARNSPWLWGDPGHTRAVQPESMIYLDQARYEQIGKSPMTDYRFCWRGDFQLVYCDQQGDHFCYVLKAVKPARAV